MTEIPPREIDTKVDNPSDLLNPELRELTDYLEPEDIKRFLFIVKHLNHKQQSLRILDVGCGNGHISRGLARLGHEVFGIDIDTESIAKANQEVGDIAKFMVLDTKDLGTQFEENYFDVIICSEVLEHLPEPSLMLDQLQPFLKTGATLIITTPNGFGPRETTVTKPVQALYKMGFGKIIMLVKRALGYKGATAQSSNPDLTHIQFFRKQELETIIRQSGKLELLEWGNANYVEKALPQSLWIKGSMEAKAKDCIKADGLKPEKASGWNTAWRKLS